MPRLSDLVDMNQTKDEKNDESMFSSLQQTSEKKPRKDSFKLYNNEEINNNLAFFSYKRKASLDESMLQKKVKKN